MIPKDPIMLLSFVNLKLRDMYDNPQAMCEDLDIDLSEIEGILKQAGYKYSSEANQYK